MVSLAGDPGATSAPASPPAGGPVPGARSALSGPAAVRPIRPPTAVRPTAAPPPGYVWVRPTPPPTNRRWKSPLLAKILTASGCVPWSSAADVRAARRANGARADDASATRSRWSTGPSPTWWRRPVAVRSSRSAASTRSTSCNITPVRSGVEYRRVVDLYTSPGSESALLHTIASGLPARTAHKTGSSARSHARRRRRRLRGGRPVPYPHPARSRIEADTGCRQDRAPAEPHRGRISLGGRARPRSRGARPAGRPVRDRRPTWPARRAGSLRTVAATLPPGSAPASLATTLRTLAPTPAAASRTTYAYRSGAVDVVAVANPASHAVTVTATTPLFGLSESRVLTLQLH